MTHDMLAAVTQGRGRPLLLRRVPRPEPARGELLLKLEASGVCHTDLHIWQGQVTPSGGAMPQILGHEGVGRVVAVGPGVSGWRTGERAGAGWLHETCGSCAECADGHESFCQFQRAHGFDVPGTFAEYVAVKAAFAVRLPDACDPVPLAPIMCAGVTAFGAIRRAAVQAGETCAIFGCGGLGMYAVQLARREGARVVAVDRDEDKLRQAAALGADDTVLVGGGDDRPWPSGIRADCCINFAPTPATWAAMVAAVKPRGRIVAAAMVSEPVPLNQEWLTASGVTVCGTSVGTREQMAELVRMHAERPLHAGIVEIGLEQATEALTALGQGRAAGRYCIRF